MQLVFGPKELLMQWCVCRIRGGTLPIGDYQAIGLAEGNKIQAVALYTGMHGKTIEISLAAGTARWANRGNIRAFLHYPFCQLEVEHLRAVVHCKNRRIIRFMRGIGFQHEGTLRNASSDGKNLYIYGMIRKEANRWLNHEQQGRQRAKSA